jgi:hypothetical protein
MAPSLQRHYSPSSLLRGHSAILFAFDPFPVSSVMEPILLQEFPPGPNRTSPVSIVSLLPCRRQYPAGVFYLLSHSEIAHSVFTVVDRLDHRSLVLTRLAQRSLTLQPSNSLISPKLTLSVGFSISITLHAATQAIRLRRSGTSLSNNESHPMDHDSNSSGHT